MQPEVRPRPRWLFRGGPGAWDALVAAIATAPTHPATWPIAPSGPSMADGDIVLLWRSGSDGGIAGLCTVVGEPEAVPRPGGPPEVIIGLRLERALGRPIAPTALLKDPVLRPLAFMDLHEATERRLTPAQDQALDVLLAQQDDPERREPTDEHPDLGSTTVGVPTPLVPLVRRLLEALGVEGERPAGGPAEGRVPSASTEPTELQAEQAEQLRLAHAGTTFTVDDAAVTWRTGVGTARSRIERLLDSGLLDRAGVLRAEEGPGIRPTRGRPPVLYRLATESTLTS